MKRFHIALLTLTLLAAPATQAAITFEAIPDLGPCRWEDCKREYRKCLDVAGDGKHWCDLALENCKESCAVPTIVISADATEDAVSLQEVPVAFGSRAFNPDFFVFGEGDKTTTIKLSDHCNSQKGLRSEVASLFSRAKAASRLFSALLSPQQLASQLGPGYFVAPTQEGRSLVAHRKRVVEVAPNRRSPSGSILWIRGGRPVQSDLPVGEVLRIIQDVRPGPAPELEVFGLNEALQHSTIHGTVSTIFQWLEEFGMIRVGPDAVDGIVELIVSILRRFGVEVTPEEITESVSRLVTEKGDRHGHS